MATIPKAFDCVEMKRQAQDNISAEWERRKDEFPSYGEFLEAGIRESKWGRNLWERIARKTPSARS